MRSPGSNGPGVRRLCNGTNYFGIRVRSVENAGSAHRHELFWVSKRRLCAPARTILESVSAPWRVVISELRVTVGE